MNKSFQDLAYGILKFSVTEMFVDFKIFTCLIDYGKVWMENESVSNWVLSDYFSAIWSFLKSTFRENLDRCETQNFRVD